MSNHEIEVQERLAKMEVWEIAQERLKKMLAKQVFKVLVLVLFIFIVVTCSAWLFVCFHQELKMKFKHLKVPLNKFTFKSVKIKDWNNEIK